ncbi:LysM domain-containing protein [Mobilisporobacter senegalensis]|uniref:LysM domain-containing protein n=1 Tax=Mobilisporobacter senegalensis TaxID=1329262 RepID=A0A3N1XVE7_9FIRM|nr:LysM peptidoglycan-binding domain-containing protein [Mobilisporobacter senegalensis]ROR29162.1 LysM domain-containing protein [Mobilisporobacter senegalensis]
MKRLNKAGVLAFGVLLSVTFSTISASAADYTIQKNDSLYKIGRLFDTPVKTIKSNNNLKSNTVYPGQVIDVKAKTHKVKKGDTLFLIAKKHKISIGALRKANNKWNNEIEPGQKLLLPAKNKAPKVKKAAAKTTKASTKAKKTATKSVIPYTQKQFDLLARLITAEASGQPYDAMVGVGAVVVNRVQSKEWPGNITKVINHVPAGYYQFTPVLNGTIKNPATDIAKKAAKAALNGSDPTKGAMFYFDDSATNEWLWSKPLAIKIGNMVFVY